MFEKEAVGTSAISPGGAAVESLRAFDEYGWARRVSWTRPVSGACI